VTGLVDLRARQLVQPVETSGEAPQVAHPETYRTTERGASKYQQYHHTLHLGDSSRSRHVLRWPVCAERETCSSRLSPMRQLALCAASRALSANGAMRHRVILLGNLRIRFGGINGVGSCHARFS
jgi:hypothetical protein